MPLLGNNLACLEGEWGELCRYSVCKSWFVGMNKKEGVKATNTFPSQTMRDDEQTNADVGFSLKAKKKREKRRSG